MKKCSQCSRTFSDDTLSFCLEDGALLSASYDHSDTQSPTVAMNAPEVPPMVTMPEILPTVASQVPPTVAAQEIPTVVANKAPTADALQTEDKKVRWYIYLLGFVISVFYDFVISRSLFELFASPAYDILRPVVKSVISVGEFELMELIIKTVFNFIIFGVLGMLLGYIWSEAKWKWGLIIVLPEFIGTGLFLSRYWDAPAEKLFPFIIVNIFSLLITILVACFFSYLGSRLRRNRS